MARPKFGTLNETDLSIKDGPVTGAGLRDAFKRVFAQVNPWAAASDKAWNKGITLSEHLACEVVTATFTHGTPQTVKLQTLEKVTGGIVLGAAGQLAHTPVVQNLGKGQASVTLYFQAGSGTAKATVVLFAEGVVQTAQPTFTTPGGGGGGTTTAAVRRTLYGVVAQKTDTAFTSVGCPAMTQAGAGTAAVLSDRFSFYQAVVSGGNGFNYNGTNVGIFAGLPVHTAWVRAQASLTNMRSHFGMGDDSPWRDDPAVGLWTMSVSMNWAGWSFRSTVNGGRWVLTNSDGSANSFGVDSGVTVVAGSDYRLVTDMSVAGIITGTIYVNGASTPACTITSSTRLPTSSAPMSVHHANSAVGANANSFYMCGWRLESAPG